MCSDFHLVTAPTTVDPYLPCQRSKSKRSVFQADHASHTAHSPNIPHHPTNTLQDSLELLESLGGGLVLGHAQDVETDRLGQGAALADSDLVTGLDTERGRAVRGEVLVALFVSAVLGDAIDQFWTTWWVICAGMTF